MEPLLKPPKVAEILGVPETTLRRWRYYGTGPKALRVGKHTRYRVEDVAAWLDEQAAAGTPANE